MNTGETIVATLKAKLLLDTLGFTSAADGIQNDLNKISTAFKQVGSKTLGFAKDASKAAMDFETAFTGVRKTVDAPEGSNAEEFFSGLRSEILQMSEELPVAATEIAGVYQAAGQLGIESENLTGFSRAMVMLASSTNLSTDQAAVGLAQFANVMGTDQTLFQNMGSAIVALGNNFATNEAQIVDFAQEMAIAGKLSGMSEADILGFGTALASMGLDAASSGTAFQRMTQTMIGAVAGFDTEAIETKMQALADSMGVTLDELNEQWEGAGFDEWDEIWAESSGSLEIFAETAGVSAEEFTKMWGEDATGAMMKFFEGFGELDVAKQLDVLDALDVGQQQQITMMQSMASNNELVSDAVTMANEAWEQNTALINEANTANSTTAAELQKVKNLVTELGIAIGDSLLPVIKDLLEDLSPIIKDLTTFAKEHPNLTKGVLIFGIAIGVLGTILSALTPVILAISAAALPISPIALAIAAAVIVIIGLVALLITNLDKIKAVVSGVAEWVGLEIEIIRIKIENFIRQLGNIDLGAVLKNIAKGLLGMLVNVINGLLNGLMSGINLAIEGINKALGWAGVHIDPLKVEIDTEGIGKQLDELFGDDDIIKMSPVDEAIIKTGEARIEELKKQQSEIAFSVTETEDNCSSLADTIAQVNETVKMDELTAQFESLGESTQVLGETADGITEVSDSVANFSTTLSGDGGLTESLSQITEMMGADALQPIAEDTLESYGAFAEQVGLVTTALGIMTPEGEGAAPASGAVPAEGGTGLISALTTVTQKMQEVLEASKTLADYWSTTFPTAVLALMEVLCVVKTDEEGNTDASGGNTLYTALGAIYGLIQDIFAVSQTLVEHWTGAFPAAIDVLKTKTGEGIGVLQDMDTTVMGLTTDFNTLQSAIEQALDAFLKFRGVTGGKISGTGKPEDLFRAEGGPVRAGQSYWVGERGVPELFTPNRSGYIIPLEDLAVSSRPEEPSIVINFEGDVIGDERSIRDLVAKAVRAGIRQEVRSAV